MEYKIPEPEENPLDSLVIYYKVLKGVEYDDRVWDRINFGRCKKSAKELLAACKTFDISKRCLDQISEKFADKELTWTFETIVKHCHDWLIRRKGDRKNDAESRKRFSDALTRQRSERALEIKGTLNGGQMLNALGDLGIIPYQGRPEGRIGSSSDGTAGRELGKAELEEETA